MVPSPSSSPTEPDGRTIWSDTLMQTLVEARRTFIKAQHEQAEATGEVGGAAVKPLSMGASLGL
jgi:hypothetical protein